MDKVMTSKDSTTAAAAAASACDHDNQQEAMGTIVEEVGNQAQQQMVARGVGRDRKPRPHLEEALRCPRCHSVHTKFCYYNNYSLLQPRYFCKACNRSWTHGGSLRNVPVGGRCRKNKRSSLPPSSSSSIKKKAEQQYLVPDSSMTEHAGFPNVPPTFMSTSFELPGSQLPSLSGLDPAQPLAPSAGSFLDMLGGGFPDYHQGNDFYEPPSSDMERVLDAIMYKGLVGNHGGEASVGGGEGSAATYTSGCGANQHKGASDKARG